MDLENYKEEMKQLSKLKRKVTESLRKAPEGRMRCEMAKGKYPQYYIIDEKTIKQYPQGKYLPKAEIVLAKALAQKEYDEMMLKAIIKRERMLERRRSFEEMPGLEKIYETLPLAKQCLITNYLMSDADFEKIWEQSGINVVNSYSMEKEILTERGEQVRSKSEKMIADKLYMKNIPYKYEAGLQLNHDRVIFPDFTLLNRKTRKEYYLEHFGMMDNSDYCKKALDKIEMYESNGIYLGDKLLVTFESSQKSVNMKQLEEMIDRIFK